MRLTLAFICLVVVTSAIPAEILVPTPFAESGGDADSAWHAAIYLEPSVGARQLSIFTNAKQELVERNFLSGRPDPAKVIVISPEEVAQNGVTGKYAFALPTLVEDPKWMAPQQRWVAEWKKKGVTSIRVPSLQSAAIALFINREAPGFDEACLAGLPLPETHLQRIKDLGEDEVAIFLEETIKGDKRFFFLIVSAPNEEWLGEALRRLRAIEPGRAPGKFPIVNTASYNFKVRNLLAITWPPERHFVEEYARKYGNPRPNSALGCNIEFRQVPLDQAQDAVAQASGTDVLVLVVRGEHWGKPPDDSVKALRSVLPKPDWHAAFLAQRKHETLHCRAKRADGSNFVLISAPTARSLTRYLPSLGSEGVQTKRQLDLRGVTHCRVLSSELSSATAAGQQVLNRLCEEISSGIGMECSGAACSVAGSVTPNTSGSVSPDEIRRVVGGFPGPEHLILLVSMDTYNADHQAQWQQNRETPTPKDPPPPPPTLESGRKRPYEDWASALNRYCANHGIVLSSPANKDNCSAVYNACRSWQSQKASEYSNQVQNGTYVWEAWLDHRHSLSCSGFVRVLDPGLGIVTWSQPFSVQKQVSGDRTHHTQKTVRGLHSVPTVSPLPDDYSQAPPDLLATAVVAEAKSAVLKALLEGSLLPSDGETWELPAPVAPDQGMLVQVDPDAGEITVQVGTQFPLDRKVLWNVQQRNADETLTLVTLVKVSSLQRTEEGLVARCRPAFEGFNLAQFTPAMVVTPSEMPDPEFPEIPDDEEGGGAGGTEAVTPNTPSPFLPLTFDETEDAYWVRTKDTPWSGTLSKGDRIGIAMLQQDYTAAGQPCGLPRLSLVAQGTADQPNAEDGYWLKLDKEIPSAETLPAPRVGLPVLECTPEATEPVAIRQAVEARLKEAGYGDAAIGQIAERLCTQDWKATPLPSVLVPRFFPGPDVAVVASAIPQKSPLLRLEKLEDGITVRAEGTPWAGKVTRGMQIGLARVAYWLDPAGKPCGDMQTRIIALGTRGLPNGVDWWADFQHGTLPEDLSEVVAMPLVAVPFASSETADTDAVDTQLAAGLQAVGVSPEVVEGLVRSAVTVSLISPQDGATQVFRVVILPQPTPQPE